MKPKFTTEQLMEVATKEAARITAKKSGQRRMHFDEDLHEDLMQEFALGALQAATREEKDKGVRTLQWTSGRGYMSHFMNTDDRFWVRHNRVNVSLESEVGQLDGSRNPLFKDSLVSKDGDPLAALIAEEEKEERAANVRQMVGRLKGRLRTVIEKRFFEGKTLTETGRELHVTRERARQLENKALEMLRFYVGL